MQKLLSAAMNDSTHCAFPESFASALLEVAATSLTRRYTGVLLGDLLKTAVVQTDPTIKGDILRKYVLVTASDCYEVVLPVSDLLPEYGGHQVLVAFADGEGKPLSKDGFAKLVVPGDKRASRYVSNIVRIRVRSAP